MPGRVPRAATSARPLDRHVYLLGQGFPTGSFDQAENIELEQRINVDGVTDGLG
jgi:hypothetical protein